LSEEHLQTEQEKNDPTGNFERVQVMPMASRMICPATTATTRMTAAETQARSAVRCRSAGVTDAVNPAKIATLPMGSMVVQIVAKSLPILMSKGDMVKSTNVLTPEVEREREKVTTWRTSLLPHADIGTSQIFVAILERSKKAFLNSNSLGFPSRSLLPSQLFYVDHSHGPRACASYP